MDGSPRARSLACDALRRTLDGRGVSVALSDDWQSLMQVNERNRNSWFKPLPKPRSAEAFWLAALDRHGDVVATHAAIRLDCSAASFGARLADLSAFHDPGDAPSEEWCFCASEAAFDTRHTVAWIVAGWNRPDWRGKGLFHPLGTLARIVAMERWRPMWVVGLVDPETVPVWSGGAAAGRRRLDRRPTICYHQQGVGRLPLHLMRFSRASVLIDVADAVRPRAHALASAG